MAHIAATRAPLSNPASETFGAGFFDDAQTFTCAARWHWTPRRLDGGGQLVSPCCVLGLLLQAGSLQHQYRDMHQQQMRQLAVQTAMFARGRIDSAAALLRMQIDAASEGPAAAPTVLAQLRRPVFGFVQPLRSANDSFRVDGHGFSLGVQEREALEAGRTLLLTASDSDAAGRLYLLLSTGAPERPWWILAELRSDWLWSELNSTTSRAGHIRFTRRKPVHIPQCAGRHHRPRGRASGQPAGQRHRRGYSLGRRRGGLDRRDGAHQQHQHGIGAGAGGGGAGARPAVVGGLLGGAAHAGPATAGAAAAGRPGCARGFIVRVAQPLQQLRRAIVQLPDRRLLVPAQPQQVGEVRQLLEAYNRSAEAIETQNSMRRVLDELDALLLPGGDYESVIDQVLTRVRAVTHANNVGLALVDPGIAGHGRLYVVNAEGGAPVNRVLLDPVMVAALREADEGMTIARCEPGRHSFLEPMQAAGSAYFWVWPVLASDELAAILTVGYAEAPQLGARIADTGTLCAQRLGLSLSNNARAERLYRQAHFDPLTQLPNRQLFREQLQQELDQVGREGTRGALLYIDLDHFKRINDSMGHEAGDKLLAIVAHRLQGCVKEGDTVARLGGDEFTVIVRGTSDKGEVAAIADRIVEAMRQPMSNTP